MKAITNPRLDMDLLVVNLLKTFVATYQQTKTAGDYGVITWDRAERLLIESALRKNRRGNTGFRGDVVMGSLP